MLYLIICKQSNDFHTNTIVHYLYTILYHFFRVLRFSMEMICFYMERQLFTKFGSDFASRILKSKGIFKFTIGKQLIQNKLSEK